jgi:hypothetical protein
LFVAATEQRRVEVRWDQAEAVIAAGNGIPEFVSIEGTITLADIGETGEPGSTGE